MTLLLIIVLTLTAAFASDKKKKEEEAKELIENAQRLSDIRAPGAPPFSLRSSARIIQDGSEVQETYAETWVSPTQWRKETTHGDQREIILRNKGKEWIWRNMPDPYQHSDHVHVTSGGLHADDIRPLPWDLPPIEQIQDRTSAATHVRCIQTKAQVYSPSMSLCFVSETGFFAFRVDPTGNDLGSVRVCTFTNYQSFGNKTFPRTVTCLVDQKPVYQENVATLAPLSTVDPSLFQPLKDARESDVCSGRVLPPRATYAPDPDLPKSFSGSRMVVLLAKIGTDGKAEEITVQRSVDKDFDNAAVRAVHRWRFDPAQCGGKPIEVFINIEVNFRMFSR